MEDGSLIAIIGIGCRFPGADGPEAFWRLLADRIDAITEVPPARWSLDEFHDDNAAAPGKMNTRWGGFIEDIDRFDAAFFGISPREAVHIDPQQRLLLEVAWAALEDAGLPAEKLAGQPVGVFVGMSSYDYGSRQLTQYDQIRDGYVNTGSALSIGANRISYLFDFRGPSIVIDTACSSSLVAAHYACQSLRRGESRIAIAGGVNLILSPAVTIGFSKLQAMAPDGRCKAFDARANGYVRGEGAGLVILKPLTSALADGDRIYAVIRGGAVNQDGRTNGLTAPNGLSQEALLRDALANAGVRPADIHYVEAHGTGTALGDPIELNALGAALAPGRPRDLRCAVGSVKTNFGHLEAAAGAAGLIKLALSLQRRQLPASLHFEKPNPYIRFDVLPLRVVTRPEPWPTESEPARGGVSSFGFGGTNAHLILEEPPRASPRASAPDDDICVLPLSARSKQALESLARAYATHLAEANNLAPLSAVCATAAVRRSHHDFRLAAVAANRTELARTLSAFVDGESPGDLEVGRRIASRRRKLAFVFPGQGSQWLGMGRELAARQPVFAEAIQRCEAAFAEHVEWSLTAELQSGQGGSRLEEVDVIQPTLFAIEIALGELWRSWGVKPDAVVGHSMGEVAAAYIAGALSLGDAARIICRRSRLARRTSGRGAMAVVELSYAESLVMLKGYEDCLAVAVSNSPSSTVLSGDPDALEKVLVRLEGDGVFCRRVKVDYASHSPQMDQLRPDLLAVLEGLAPRKSKVPLYSTVTGAIASGTDLGPEYWADNLRQPVLFADVIAKLLKDGIDVFLEVSPHPILLPAIQQCLTHLDREGIAVGSLKREQDERRCMLSSVARLYAMGQPVEWRAVYPEPTEYIALPGYPWQRERFWFIDERTSPSRSAAPLRAVNPLIGEHIRLATDSSVHLWQRELSPDSVPFLKEYRLGGELVVAPAAYVEMALEAAGEALPENAFVTLENVRFHKPFVLSDNEPRRVQVVLTRQAEGGFQWQVFGEPTAPRGAAGFSSHATGDICIAAAADAVREGADWLAGARARCPALRSASDYYESLSTRGLEYGAAFPRLESMWIGDHEAVACLAPVPSECYRYHVHPALLSSAIQVLSLLESTNRSSVLVPVSVDHVRVLKPRVAAQRLWAHAAVNARGHRHCGDVRLITGEGELVAELNGITLGPAELAAAADVEELFYTVKWEKQAGCPVATQTPDPGAFLIFADARGAADSLASEVRERGGLAVLVVPGAGRHVPDNLSENIPCQIDPACADHYSELLDELTQRGIRLGSAVHLWSVDGGVESPDAARSAESALLLVQALARSGGALRLCLVTRGAQRVRDDDDVSPFQAPLWGLARTVAQEHPELSCTAIDLDPEATNLAVRAIVGELLSDDTEQQVVFRGGERFVARLAHIPAASGDMPAPSQESQAIVPRTLRGDPAKRIWDDSTYVVTGGLGGLGLVVARWLVDLGARTLVLSGRRQPQPEAQEVIDAMRRSGARVVVDCLDVSDAAAVDAAFRRWRRDLPPVRGIVHAAGILDDGVLLQQTPERFRRVMAPKVLGAWNLHRASLGSPVDMFLLFSSASSVLGSAGQSNYAAANQFLDALAHYRRVRALPGTAINWGPWAEVGLAAQPDRGARLESRGIKSLSPRQGVDALNRLLATDPVQAVVMSVDWREWRSAVPALARMPFFSRLETAGVADATSRDGETRDAAVTVLEAPPEQRETLVAERLRQHAAIVLRIPASKVDVDQPLVSMGIDSLMAVELKSRIERDLDIAIPLLQVIKGPSLSELARTFLGAMTGDAAPASPSDVRTPAAEGSGKSLLLSILSLRNEDAERVPPER